MSSNNSGGYEGYPRYLNIRGNACAKYKSYDNKNDYNSHNKGYGSNSYNASVKRYNNYRGDGYGHGS